MRVGAGPGVRTDDGVLLHVETDGPDDAALTVVLVHGFAASMDQMAQQRATLARHARVVALDLRGHGHSGWRAPRRVDVDRLARDLTAVVESRTRGPVVLVGHSLGGMAVMALARSRPDLVGSVVAGVALLSTSSGGLARTVLPGPVADIATRTGLAHAVLLAAWLLAPLADAARPFRRSWGRRWLARRLVADPGRHPDVPATMADVRSGLPRANTVAFYPGIVDHDGTAGLELLRDVPSLVLTGTEDRTIPAEHSRRIADALGGRTTLVHVPGAGHMVTVTHPEPVGRELVALLQRVERALPRAGAPAGDPDGAGDHHLLTAITCP